AKGWYTFVVAIDARKKKIGQEIARLYKVTVTQVRTERLHGKSRRSGKKQQPVVTSDWKKAFVRLGAGQRIEAFQAVEGEKK
ncbi:50S ribosomal protein L23, partial [Candidatus Gottesmanbacteria bacterium]|nr:50S ribosomal protein L23 [Candidatus Gottesmanbacteria bacterium]